MTRKNRQLLILLYVEAHAPVIATRIMETIYPTAVRGENSKRRHAFLEIREMENKGMLRRIGAHYYLP